MNDNNISKIDLNLLKSLRALLDERHVGRAAAKMNVSQSAMSHTLTRLRAAFDDPLFIRNAKGLEPTNYALDQSDKLRFILDEIETLFTPKSLDLSTTQRRFRIHTHDFLVASYLSRAIEAINTEAPHIVFDLKMLDSNSYSKLDNGELDMIIGSGIKANPRFIQKRLINEELVSLVDNQHPILENWSSDALFSYPHIKSSLIDDKDDPVTLYGEKEGLPPRQIGLYVESLNLQLTLLPHSRLIAILPESIAKQGQRCFGLKMKKCPFPLPSLTIKSVWHERHHNDQLHKWVRDKVDNIFKNTQHTDNNI
ncbi:LysR family transcriptional regulator [Photobacterium chitinilyticum]|uniref:LysR family transcriptional regulator n=1 Tax=Photobacterium chitinilyticum TaxID=2485123 RepID=UPI003D0EE576